MFTVLLVIYLLAALGVIGLVLIQQGKGADMGSSFGAGASGTVFGSSGAGNFMTKTTTSLATVFFVLSIVLGNLTAGQIKKTDEWENLEAAPAVETVVPVEEDVPVTSTKEQSSDVPN